MVVFLPTNIGVKSDHQGKHLQVQVDLVLRLVVLEVSKELVKEVFVVGLGEIALVEQHDVPDELDGCEVEDIVDADEFS